MARIHESWIPCQARRGLLLALLIVTAVLADTMLGQQDERTPIPDVCEGSLLFRSPVSGAYETIPLAHTDATFDVRGLVAAATVTQQYENSSSASIEAVYVFPLPHDAAVYDMEIRIGNRIIRSKIHERAEAKQ